MSANKTPLRNSLASKKKPVPKLKNVLAQPLPQYWPEINKDDRKELQEKLHEAVDEENKTKHDKITLGMSSCLRLLKRNEISCLLLSSEIKPKFITTQIIFSVINKSETIAVLVVPELKTLTNDVFNISSLTLAIAKGQESNLVLWIKKKAATFPIPDKLLKYYGATECTKTISSPQLGKCNKVEIRSNNQSIKTNNINLENLYLPRKSTDCRAFIPGNAAQTKSETKKWSDFISLSKNAELPEPMDVEIEPVKTKKLSLKELLQKTIKIQKEKNLEGGLIQEKNNGKTEISNAAKEVEPPKINLKKRKKDENPKQPSNYVTLKVNKIQGNPDRVKKRKKKTKK